jgi:hypothetical protein
MRDPLDELTDSFIKAHGSKRAAIRAIERSRAMGKAGRIKGRLGGLHCRSRSSSQNSASPASVLEKKRRGAGDTAPAVNAENQAQPRSTQSPTPAQARWSVSSGRQTLGFVCEFDGRFVALDVNGIEIGRFVTLHIAMRALSSWSS